MVEEVAGAVILVVAAVAVEMEEVAAVVETAVESFCAKASHAERDANCVPTISLMVKEEHLI